jgi:hypothetical protein
VLNLAPAAGSEDAAQPGGGSSLIDEIVREGARRMLAAALQAEVSDYIARFTGELDENGRRLVVRNGTAQPQQVLTAAGAVEVTAPRVNDKRVLEDTGERQRFSSAILPAWARKTPASAASVDLLGSFVLALSMRGRHPASARTPQVGGKGNLCFCRVRVGRSPGEQQIGGQQRDRGR